MSEKPLQIEKCKNENFKLIFHCRICNSQFSLAIQVSARSASIGSSRAARHAGYTPDTSPTLPETSTAAVTASQGSAVGTDVVMATSLASIHAMLMPIAPPNSDKMV